MDYYSEKLDNQKDSVLQKDGIAAFGLSLQGTSHINRDPPVPCQDAYDIRWLDQQKILIAAIADGVGSCELSHWGAHTAVNSVLDSVENALTALTKGHRLRLTVEDVEFRTQMKQIMLNAFQTAQNAVENLGDQSQPPQPVFSFQSTLTLAIYDGDCLFHGHVGDDGIVAQLPDGTVEMATRRVKGDEANSVFPLQSGESCWLFGVVPHVVGFVMATDGVLDSFVATKPNSRKNNYFNGVCYNFIENAIYTLAEGTTDAPQKALQEYKSFMMSDSYRSQVEDDLTLVAVVSPKAVRKATHPAFSIELWKKADEENHLAQQQALYGKTTAQKTMAPVSSQTRKKYHSQEPAKSAKGQKAFTPEQAPNSSQHFKAQLPPETLPDKEKRTDRPSKTVSSTIKIFSKLTLLVLILLLGVTLGRTFLAPVKSDTYEDLQQRYDQLVKQDTGLKSQLLDENNLLKNQVKELHTLLGEKEQHLKTLNAEKETLTQQVSILQDTLKKYQDLAAITSETAPGAPSQTISAQKNTEGSSHP